MFISNEFIYFKFLDGGSILKGVEDENDPGRFWNWFFTSLFNIF